MIYQALVALGNRRPAHPGRHPLILDEKVFTMAQTKEELRAAKKAWGIANKDRVAATAKRYREANKEKVAAQKKKWYDANKDIRKVKNAAYYDANKEAIRTNQKGYMTEYREANRDELLAKNVEYNATPQGRFNHQKRSAKRRGIEFLLTFDEWSALWAPYEYGRGKGGDSFCMCRDGDAGAYEVGNVRIDTISNNMVEANHVRRMRAQQ